MRNLIGFISPHSGNLLAGGFVCLRFLFHINGNRKEINNNGTKNTTGSPIVLENLSSTF